eukprot:777609-Amphidinium_carterae.1
MKTKIIDDDARSCRALHCMAECNTVVFNPIETHRWTSPTQRTPCSDVLSDVKRMATKLVPPPESQSAQLTQDSRHMKETSRV